MYPDIARMAIDWNHTKVTFNTPGPKLSFISVRQASLTKAACTTKQKSYNTFGS